MQRNYCIIFVIGLLCTLLLTANAYLPSCTSTKRVTIHQKRFALPENNFESDEEMKRLQQNDLSERIRVQLKSEIVSPFRLLRQFVFFGLGASAGLGLVTAIPQLIIANTRPNPTIPLETALQNAGIDVAGVIVTGFLLYREFTSNSETIDRFTEREQRLTGKLSGQALEEREKRIALLPVDIQVSENNENITKIVSVGDLQSKGRQNVIIVAGKKTFVKDAIISARIEGSDLFTKFDTIVIPVVTNDEQIDQGGDKKKGFGDSQEELLTAPYFGKPMQMEVWMDYVLKEIDQAERQGNKQARKEGILIALKKSGKVVRRGLGLPIWKQLVEEVDSANKNK